MSKRGYIRTILRSYASAAQADYNEANKAKVELPVPSDEKHFIELINEYMEREEKDGFEAGEKSVTTLKQLEANREETT